MFKHREESVDMGKFTKAELAVLRDALKVVLIQHPLNMEYRKDMERLYDRVTKTLDVYFPDIV